MSRRALYEVAWLVSTGVLVGAIWWMAVAR